jgi:hypothetical protein
MKDDEVGKKTSETVSWDVTICTGWSIRKTKDSPPARREKSRNHGAGQLYGRGSTVTSTAVNGFPDRAQISWLPEWWKDNDDD